LRVHFSPIAMVQAALLIWAMLAFAPATAAAEGVKSVVPDPQIATHPGYVDEKICSSCHAGQTVAFATSHHAQAMAVASDATVRGDFDNASFEGHGVEAAFFRKDRQFFVRTEGADGKQADFEVKYTFAYEPLQQYLIDLGGGKLQTLDIAWDAKKRAWFWLGAGSAAKPGSTFHWTGPFYRWNRTCIDCHSTDPQTNFRPQTNTYESSYVATSIGCQSCHGGGAKHVDWATPQAQASAKTSLPRAGLSEVGMDTCLACHSRRTRLVGDYQPGGTFLDNFSPAMLRSDLYFADGQILDEVFEYGSFQQSKMARAGVTCFDCHRAHEGSVKAVGNALCTQCHTPEKQERFTANDPSGHFDTPAHTHHPEGSSGALCANCHMPQRTYMKVDPRRDHSFVIPRPDLSDRYGTPNACTSCHEGKTNVWASQNLDTWFGTSWRDRPTIAHAFGGAANGDAASLDALRTLLRDEKQSGIVRGSAVTELSRMAGADVVADVKTATQSVDPLVRLGAAEAALNLPAEVRLDAVGKLLGDETRAVRVAAAKALGRTQSLDFLGNQRRDFDLAVADLKAYVEANADVAEIQSTHGTFLLEQGHPQDAEKTLRQAIELDPSLPGARINLAELYRAIGDGGKSEETYAEAVTVSPHRADLRFGHGLSLVRQKAMQQAIGELETAVRLEPNNARYRMTAAVALDSVGKTEQAFALFDPAQAAAATDANSLGAAIQMGLKLRRYPETLIFATALAGLQPDNQQVAELVRQLQAASQDSK
jgi:Flp pilus assembly protein TadD